MSKKNSKFLSLILSLVLFFTMTLFSPSVLKVYAEETNSGQANNSSQFLESLKNDYLESLKEDILKEGNEYKYKGNLDYFDDNKKEGENKNESYNPEENVRVIVQLEEDSIKDYVVRQSYSGQSLQQAAKDEVLVNKVLDSQVYYKNEIKKIDNDAEFKNKYTLLLNGFSMDTKYGDIEKIKKLPGVKHVSVVKTYYPDMSTAKELSKVLRVWQDYGYKGEGLVVSIIDSGIDYTHKDMRISEGTEVKLNKYKVEEINRNVPNAKGRYYTEKIPYGYNFADDNEEIIDTDSMHGMHVAGIIAANCESQEEINSFNGIKGVAPEAQLLAMKVFSNREEIQGCKSDDVIAAIEDSIAHGADIINMSLGIPRGSQNPEDPEQKAIREAVDQGVIVCVSAGNSTNSTYPYRYKDMKDYSIVGTPGVAEDSLQVASFENDASVTFGLDYEADKNDGVIPFKIGYEELSPIEMLKGKYELVECGIGKSEDFEGKDLSGKIALIKRGEIYYTKKIINAEKAGAVGALIYNQTKEERPDSGGNSIPDMDAKHWAIKIPSLSIGNSDGVKLVELINNNVRISFGDKMIGYENGDKGDMSSFSSWGPAPNLDFKPQITGIGGKVYSTVNNNEYTAKSGTSMASPYVAGVMALIKQHINESGIKFNTEKEKVDFAKALAVNTAEVKMDKNHPEVPYSPRRQGAGLINAKAALDNMVTVTYDGQPVAALKEMDKTTEFTLTLKNHGNRTVTYNVVDLSGVLTDVDKDLEESEMPYNVKLKGAKLKFNENDVKVTTGQAIQLKVTTGQSIQLRGTITMDETTPVNSFAEGFIRFVPVERDVPEIGIPYMGFYGDWSALKVIDDPAYKESSILKETNLFTGRPNWMDERIIDVIYLAGKKPNPEQYGINPDNHYMNNVIPGYTFLRNAKELTIDITNAEGHVIRTIDKGGYQFKHTVEENKRYEKPMVTVREYNWVWDGKVYDSQSGEYTSVEEGQYFVNGRVKADCEDAEEQVVSMPVKIDKTAPKIEIKGAKYEVAQAGKYRVKFKLDDAQGTGVKSIAFYRDGEKYLENYKWSFKPEDLDYDEETGLYSKEIELEDKVSSKIKIGVADYAGNVSESNEITVFYYEQEFWDMNVKFDKEYYEEGEDVTFSWTLPQEQLDRVDHFKVKWFDWKEFEDHIINTGKQMTYTIKGDQGMTGDTSSNINIMAYDASGKELSDKMVTADINDKNLNVKFDNIADQRVYKDKKLTIAGQVSTNHFKSFKINGKDVQLGSKTLFGWLRLGFKHEIELEQGKWNKVKVEIIGEDDKVVSFAYNIMYDDQAPIITLENPASQEENVNIFVGEDVNTYTVKGTVKDDTRGYELSINGQTVLNTKSAKVLGDDSLREFEYEVPLNDTITFIKVEAKDILDNTTTRIIKIEKTNGENNNPFIIQNLTGDKTFHNGDQVKLRIKATNVTKTNKSATLILGLFDENNTMVNVTSLAVEVKGEDDVVISGILNIPEEGKYKLKVLMWDSIETMNTISEAVEYTVEN